MTKVILFALSTLSLNAFAIASFSAPYSSCRSMQSAIARDGEAIVYIKSDIYKRVVRDGSFCNRADQVIGSPVSVMAKDNAACWIGYACKAQR